MNHPTVIASFTSHTYVNGVMLKQTGYNTVLILIRLDQSRIINEKLDMIQNDLVINLNMVVLLDCY